jgi:hypothetical protein
MILLAASIAILSVLIVAAPLFWRLQEPELNDTFAIHDRDSLDSMCKQVVTQYKQGEAAFQSGDLSKREWNARRAFLRGRYLDFALRLKQAVQEEKERG